MKPLLACTTEELALLVTFCGYPEVGKGIAESSMESVTPENWQSVMQATIHQLMLKQIWDYEREANNEAPISEEMETFIESYVESQWMIRCSHVPEQHILMIHKMDENTWLSHLIDRDIIHEFAYITSEELPSHIKEYYSFTNINFVDGMSFQLTEQDFDLLSDKSNLSKLEAYAYLSSEENEAFNEFINALGSKQWSLNNISLFNLPTLEADPMLTNIMFFLPSSKGIWVVEYSEDSERPVHIYLRSYEEWGAMLDEVGNIQL
ncbi:hypothetical protein [Mesobacillus jeotgali]|uniref:SMI1/KNR4 family protein n=1 Tax=Mesobacillus jeotgali TaxID=129985 RepID=A0ABY9VIQ4_9BACI|nr:hypothetical protein [Mesobacillus jeotgali]WNF22701.1 hypothetical protein RH061_21520 [Mesobacillus jeotgali]